ncbi:sugar transferase [Sporosarcina pasteurii]|uniref:Colanic biosynthesis UDP-glucose lipid carrier transferase n=1 Tax=Sporosarcina pasteurii TaxID=1474 RepID=A0A380CB38_SPOPA|nr:sugar transferase [Sporosarcina pasteurii]MDS9472732.1 sugar transferase [Sporosarcina pasteurii]SUJ15443.1 Putative colanic biosynthesis UDP-glucose lipid carrier transferase [Sporosarcina pasteurii]
MEKTQVGQPYHRTAMYVKDVQKRVFDSIVTLVLLLLLWPILLFCLLVHLINGDKPIFSKCLYGGKNNQPLVVRKPASYTGDDWKTRSVNDSNDQVDAHKRRLQTEKLLRKLKFEEMLLLLNVIKGDMSLIGPRAEIIKVTQRYCPYQSQRLSIKPGLTGYAQVNTDVIDSHNQMIEYDLYYMQHQSILLDCKILIQAVKLLIRGKVFC